MRNSFRILGLVLIISCTSSYSQESTTADTSASKAEQKASPSLTEEEIQKFPILQKARIAQQLGGVRGVGILANYPDGGPRKVFVSRTTSPSSSEAFLPISLVRILDPMGNLVVAEEWTDQKESLRQRIINIPEGPAGIWRISFSGGRSGDSIELGIPESDAWGVRGEMALGVSETTPRPAWLWVPSSSAEVLIGIESGRVDGIRVVKVGEDEVVLAQPERDPLGRPGRLVFPSSSEHQIVRLDLPSGFHGNLFIEGAPGLLCPTREMAEKLRGGTLESHGMTVSGPLQARARDWMIRQLPQLSEPLDISFPEQIPDDLKDLQIHALAFGKYGPLNNLAGMIEAQNRNLSPDSPFLGSFLSATEQDEENNWSRFRPARWSPFFDSASLAAAVDFKSPLNPVYQNPQLLNRATLAAFYYLVSMQGDDLLREGNLFERRHPITLAFFVYPGSLSQPYLFLRDQLSPEAKEIWKQGLMAVADKHADFLAYQSNQWAHMLRAHLDVYLATGEERFLGYFERLATAFFDNTFGPDSKFGQHPAGYFLEEFGPDGNYDRLNLFALVSAYLDYKELDEADPELLQKIHDGIEKNLQFRSLFWLPLPDGNLQSPTAINHRTLGPLSGVGYPGDMMARAYFPLGARRHALTPVPSDTGMAWTMPHVANTDEWAKRVIQKGLQEGADAFLRLGKEGVGWWLPHLSHAFSLKPTVEPAELPVESAEGEWTLPGITAWKKGAFYCVIFEDIPGGKKPARGILGGAPMALWTKECGPFLLSMHADRPGVPLKEESALTFSCIFFRTSDDGILATGGEPARRVPCPENSGYCFESRSPEGNGVIFWRYIPNGNELEMQVRIPDTEREDFLNLPFNTSIPDSKIDRISKHMLEFTTPTGTVRIRWPEEISGNLEPSKLGEVTRLVLSLPSGASSTIWFEAVAPSP